MIKYKISVIITYHNCANTIERCLKSLISNTFKNTEIICVNNGSDDGTHDIVLSYESEYSNIKLINLPSATDVKTAQNIGLGIASGEYVYFLDGSDILEENIVNTIYSGAKERPEIKTGKIYKRSFLENSDDITEIIEKKIDEKLSEFKELMSENEKRLSAKLDKFEQVTAENIQNKIYNLICRHEQSEKFISEKNAEYKLLIDKTIEDAYRNKQEDNKYLYQEISKVYDSIHEVYEYINKEISKKTEEINRIYEEITNNYSYTENIVEEKNSYLVNELKEQSDTCIELKRDLEQNFVNFRKLMDLKLEAIISENLKEKIEGEGKFEFVENSSVKTLSDNIDKLYETLNESTEAFYKEITGLYSDVNEKLTKQREEDNWLLNKGLEELKTELTDIISSKAAELREELNADK